MFVTAVCVSLIFDQTTMAQEQKYLRYNLLYQVYVFVKGPWSASAIFDDIEIIDKAW